MEGLWSRGPGRLHDAHRDTAGARRSHGDGEWQERPTPGPGQSSNTVKRKWPSLYGKADATPQAAETKAVELAPKGQKPGGVAVNTVEITANVEAIDYQTRAIALKGPRGNTRIFKVSDAVERFNEIKVGDQVVIRVTEAIALAVVKP